MLFHSTQATSQALQPMHVVVSTSLHTCRSRCVSWPGMLPAWPEIFWMRSVAWLIAAPLRLLDLHEESLEFRRVGVGIDHRRRNQIRQRFGGLAFVFGNAAIAPMDGE